jgi:hypothetical protein
MHHSLQRSSSKRLDVRIVRQVFSEKVTHRLAGKIAWQLRKNLILQPQQKKGKGPDAQDGWEPGQQDAAPMKRKMRDNLLLVRT